MGLFDRLKSTLSKTRQVLSEKVEQILTFHRSIDEELFVELEEALIEADVGVYTAMHLVQSMRTEAKQQGIKEADKLKQVLKDEMAALLTVGSVQLNSADQGLTVIVCVGVNGVGKTTTIGKLAYFLKSQGKKVLLAAGDTFRAGAIEQLEIWAQRANAEIIRQNEGSDPAAVVYDAIQAAKARKIDYLIIDTAGRLHTKVNLMEELRKIRRVVEREYPGAPHEVLLVLDATTGQNAINQARVFAQDAGVTGIVLTKLDGTARGGIVLAIACELKIPVKLIGVGENIQDIQEFKPNSFVDALFD